MARATSWYGRGDEYIACPHPECNHVGYVITKVHCRMEHNMERDEIERLYGLPIIRTMKEGKLLG